MGWRIKSWSRELGRGEIESDAGVLPFDGHVAEVGDFHIGEPVEIVLERGRVTRIWPPAFQPVLPGDHEPVAELTPGWRAGLAALENLGAYIFGWRKHEDVVELTFGTATLGATARFEHVLRVELGGYGSRFQRVVAWPWRHVARTEPQLAKRLGIERGGDSVVTSFEPARHGQSSGIVVAHRLSVTTRPPLAAPHLEAAHREHAPAPGCALVYIGPAQATKIADCGLEPGARFPLEPDRPLSIGRGEACEVRVHALFVARRHARVHVIALPDQLVLEVADGGSIYGTWCEGRRVRHDHFHLSPGQRFAIANELIFEFVVGTPGATARSP